MKRAGRGSLLALAVVVACSGDTDKAATAVAQSTPPASPVSATAITTATTPVVPAPPRPDTGAVSPDSELPPPSYALLPGWLVMGAKGFPRHIGDSTDADPRAYTGIDIDSGIIVYPYDARWSRVGTGTALALLQPNGPITLYPGGAAEKEVFTPATLLRARALPPVERRKFSMGWMLPADRSGTTTELVIRDSIAPDSSTRTWAMAPVRFRLRLTGRRTAKFWAAHVAGDSTLIFSISVDSVADKDMGFDSDSLLALDNWRMPDVLAAFRLGEHWPLVAVLSLSGHECTNYSIVVFDSSSVKSIEEPGYYECPH